MFKNIFHMKNKIMNSRTLIVNNSKRFISGKPIKPIMYNMSPLSFGLLGAGTAGLLYLIIYGRNLSYSYKTTLGMPAITQLNYFDAVVQ